MFVLRKFVGACLLCMALNGVCGELVDINSADANALAETITGIGPARAAAIIDYRDSHGRFETVDDLVLVKGIGAKTIEKNRQKLTVSDKQ
jgi:competence protein ComEA